MIIGPIRYFVNTQVPSVNYCDGLDRCILYCILFVFMFALLCFCVATKLSVNKDLSTYYNKHRSGCRNFAARLRVYLWS